MIGLQTLPSRAIERLRTDPIALARWTTVAVALLLLCRRPASLFAPQFWAEDGAVFYAGQLTGGALHALGEPYSGYLHIVPRLTSIVAAHVPVVFAPLVFALVAYAVAVWACSMFVAERYRGIVRSDALRALVCCAFASVPALGELQLTLTNLHWFLTLAVMLLLVAEDPVSAPPHARSLVRTGALVLAVLSAPETAVLIPLAIWKLVRPASTVARFRAASFLVAVAVQIFTYVRAGQSTPPAPPDAALFSSLAAFTQRVALSTMIGDRFAVSLGAGAALIALLSITVAATVAGMRLPAARRRLALLLIACFAWLYLAIDGRDLIDYFELGKMTNLGERYMFLPAVTFIVGVAVVIDTLPAMSSALRCAVFCLCFIIGGWQNFALVPFADDHWATYAPQIEAWRRAQRLHQPSPELVVPVNPGAFSFTLPQLYPWPATSSGGR